MRKQVIQAMVDVPARRKHGATVISL